MGFDLKIEGDFTAFLSVELKRLSNNSIHLFQKGLIKKTLQAASMSDCNPNATPSTGVTLGKDVDGEVWPQTPWKYSSIVGMLIYLCTNTRPDISYAVSCVARFSSSPKKSHATAVKTILRYLKKTMDKGVIFRFSGNLSLEAYCDSDHCGLFGREAPRDPDGARSRGGYIIFFGGVPLIWKSSLLQCITISTLESEYMQLSLTMVVLLGLKNMLEELISFLQLDPLSSSIRATVFEDNNGALLLATNQNITSRTRYLHVRWHHFWDNVSKNNGEDGKPVILKISTEEQLADFFTKGLMRVLFERNRHGVNGW